MCAAFLRSKVNVMNQPSWSRGSADGNNLGTGRERLVVMCRPMLKYRYFRHPVFRLQNSLSNQNIDAFDTSVYLWECIPLIGTQWEVIRLSGSCRLLLLLLRTFSCASVSCVMRKSCGTLSTVSHAAARARRVSVVGSPGRLAGTKYRGRKCANDCCCWSCSN